MKKKTLLLSAIKSASQEIILKMHFITPLMKFAIENNKIHINKYCSVFKSHY